MFSAVDVVRSVAHYAVTYGRNHSPLGRNLLFCMNQYKCSLCDIFNISRIDGFIVKRVFNCSTDSSGDFTKAFILTWKRDINKY